MACCPPWRQTFPSASPSAGLLVSLYALGVAIGAPVLTALTGKLPRKALLLALMALFTAGNLLAWQAPRYEALVAARILTGLSNGVFFSIGSTIATGPVPREKAASAIAIMFTGLSVALVTGVPLGTFIGQHFGWRETFLAVSVLGVVAFIGSAVFVPRHIAHTPPRFAGATSPGAGRAPPAAGVRQDSHWLRRHLHSVHLSRVHRHRHLGLQRRRSGLGDAGPAQRHPRARQRPCARGALTERCPSHKGARAMGYPLEPARWQECTESSAPR